MIKKLLCNGKENPIGVSSIKIKLSIEVEDENVKKVLFKVLDIENELNENAIVVETENTFADIDCSKIKGQTVYCWYVEVYTDKGIIVSEKSYFETDLSDFSYGKWICNAKFNGSVSQFKRVFNIKGKVDKARLYIVGLGLYESKINGKRTDNFYYKPLLTDFDVRKGLGNLDYDEENFNNGNKTICYNTFDVTDMLSEGDNELSILLGTGWFYDTDKTVCDPKFYFNTPKLIFELYYWQNGKKNVIKSDDECLCRNTNKRSQLFDCDSEDFSLKSTSYHNVEYAEIPAGKLISSQCDLDCIKEEISPTEINLFNRKAYDFGKNHSGSLHLRIKGKRGCKLIIKYFEFYDEKGFNSNSSSCILYNERVKPVGVLSQTDRYVLSGNIDEISPLFSWKCYRYVTIDCDAEYEILDLKSLFICSDISSDGEFSCSDKFIKKFYDAYILTQYDNLHCGVSSDCPHREKLPYTGDGSLIIDSVMYNFDCEEFYRKWFDDIVLSQGNNGWIPYSAPYLGGSGGYFWSNVITVLPLKLYYRFGNKAYLDQSVAVIKNYINYCVSMLNEKYLLDKTCIRWLIGEWATPKSVEIDVTLFNTIAFYEALENSEKISKLLCLTNDEKYYKSLKMKIKKAINKNYFNEEKLNYGNGKQGINLFALSLGIVPQKYIRPLFQKVVECYKKKPRFDTGIIVTPVVLDYLTRSGEQELAYKIFTNKGKSSFYSMLKGETTLCEHWNKKWPDKLYDLDGIFIENSEDASHCHPMFGSVVAWMHKYVAGLDLSDFYKKEITYSPKLISKIKYAEAKKQTEYGTAAIEYKKGEKFTMQISIPYGCKGKIILCKNDLKNLYLADRELKAEKGLYTVNLNGGKYVFYEK